MSYSCVIEIRKGSNTWALVTFSLADSSNQNCKSKDNCLHDDSRPSSLKNFSIRTDKCSTSCSDFYTSRSGGFRSAIHFTLETSVFRDEPSIVLGIEKLLHVMFIRKISIVSFSLKII